MMSADAETQAKPKPAARERKNELMEEVNSLGLHHTPASILKRLIRAARFKPGVDPWAAADNRWLAEQVGMSERTVRYSLTYLRDVDLLVTWRRSRKGGGRISSQHFIQVRRMREAIAKHETLNAYGPSGAQPRGTTTAKPKNGQQRAAAPPPGAVLITRMRMRQVQQIAGHKVDTITHCASMIRKAVNAAGLVVSWNVIAATARKDLKQNDTADVELWRAVVNRMHKHGETDQWEYLTGQPWPMLRAYAEGTLNVKKEAAEPMPYSASTLH